MSTWLGESVREVNSDGEVSCTAEALGAPIRRDWKVCWCLPGVPWGDDVRKGLASLVRQGLTPRVEIAIDPSVEPSCGPETDGLWYGCVVMNRRWDSTVSPQVMLRVAPPEEQLDMALKKLDACHRMSPHTALRVLGVKGSQPDAVEMPQAMAKGCSVVYHPDEGSMWTGKLKTSYCASQPGSCTTTPCECRRSGDLKLELFTPQGRRCWACSRPGQEQLFRVNALAEKLGGGSVSWWPPHGIHCPPILWLFMDWRAVSRDCPALFGSLVVMVLCLIPRRIEEMTSGRLPWTRVTPLYGPTLKRGEVWRFFTFSFFHVAFSDLFHNLLTLIDTFDVESTPAIVLGDGSNLKCGFGVKQNFMCYPSIGLGTFHAIGVAAMASLVGGMCSTWINFKNVAHGASVMGFGLSGAIVALYALYAGADLDQTINVQRSFQDWVWLRLIFVGFHIVMEVIRSFSQRDPVGLFAHTAAFASGFGYVLYFLPPMGDGSLLASDRAYIVPCAYEGPEGSFATGQTADCVRLFSQLYEYPVKTVRENAFFVFVAAVTFTIFNAAVLQRHVRAAEPVFLAGCEVSSICCSLPKRPPGAPRTAPTSHADGIELLIWCEITAVTKARWTQAWAPSVEVRYLPRDPRREPDLLLNSSVAEATGSTRALQAEPDQSNQPVEVKDHIFLHVRFSRSSFVQLLLRDGSRTIGHATLTMAQVMRFNHRGVSEHRVRLQEVPQEASDAAAPAVPNLRSAVLHVNFRKVDLAALPTMKANVRGYLDEKREELRQLEQHLQEMSLVADDDALAEVLRQSELEQG